jgi:hypothetical protein
MPRGPTRLLMDKAISALHSTNLNFTELHDSKPSQQAHIVNGTQRPHMKSAKVS